MTTQEFGICLIWWVSCKLSVLFLHRMNSTVAVFKKTENVSFNGWTCLSPLYTMIKHSVTHSIYVKWVSENIKQNTLCSLGEVFCVRKSDSFILVTCFPILLHETVRVIFDISTHVTLLFNNPLADHCGPQSKLKIFSMALKALILSPWLPFLPPCLSTGGPWHFLWARNSVQNF